MTIRNCGISDGAFSAQQGRSQYAVWDSAGEYLCAFVVVVVAIAVGTSNDAQRINMASPHTHTFSD
jgi:hypothetical protein